MCSSDGPMAMGVVLYISTNDHGHSITSSNTSVDVQGLPGALTQCRRGVKFDTYGYVGIQYGSPSAPVVFPWLGVVLTVALLKI